MSAEDKLLNNRLDSLIRYYTQRNMALLSACISQEHCALDSGLTYNYVIDNFDKNMDRVADALKKSADVVSDAGISSGADSIKKANFNIRERLRNLRARKERLLNDPDSLAVWIYKNYTNSK